MIRKTNKILSAGEMCRRRVSNIIFGGLVFLDLIFAKSGTFRILHHSE